MTLNKKLLRRFLRSTRAVSEVVGDILLLAISISMAISLSVYIFNLIPSEENKAINYDVKAYLLPAGSSGEYKLIIERVSGDLLPEPSDISVILRNSSATLGLSYNSSESIVGQKYVYDVLGGTIYPGNKYQIDVIDKSANTMIISGTISAGYVSYEEEVVGTNDVDIIVLGLTVYDPSDGDNRIVPGEPLEARIYLRILRGSSSIKYVNFTMNFPTYLADILFKTFTDIAIINDTTQENATLSIILTPSSQAPYLLLSLNMTNTSNSTHIIDTEITLRIRDTSDLAPGKYSLYSYVTSSTPSDPITSNNYASDDYIVETQVSNISNINNLAIQDVKLDHKIYPAGSQVSGTIEIANIGNTNITSFSLRISLLQRDDTVQTIKYVDYYVDI
ncbi:MAG: type IV pilin N-terminal domain-containing protein, partial [Euryarchaeota archaeon]|nr:type IV pilin N-terminal domain-containing protein [Euryarchaeota archaeon]